jgi:hypothetical protein
MNKRQRSYPCKIVRREKTRFALCDQLEAQINASAHTAETLSATILQELFDQSSSAKATADKNGEKN